MKASLSAGIIAAGQGERLRSAGPLKPLVQVRGKPLVHWVADGLRRAGARRLTVLFNSSGSAAMDYLERSFPEVTWNFLSQDTASSWESFRLVSRRLAAEAGGFLVSTVDALIRPSDVARFAREARPHRAALGLTRFVEDEKPLWADCDAEGRVTALGADVRARETATCGLYWLTREAAAALPPAAAHARLRDFWAGLVREEAGVRGILLGDAVDVDRPEDLASAEKVTACFAA